MDVQKAFDRLAPFVREFIYTQSWDSLRPLQVSAIDGILNFKSDILITTGTASGKTEAAFLPSLSLIADQPFGSIRILYVGPLKALINDQFRRLVILCENGGIPIFRWHGDISLGKKSKLLENPGGILQITPESIESILINKTSSLHHLFNNLEFVVIDEVHTFIESDRGIQLQSQLQRLSLYSSKRPRRIGLSATVGDIEIAKKWINPEKSQSVIVINPKIEVPSTRISHFHFIAKNLDVPPALLDDLYELTKNCRSLIFCNSRQNVEQITNKLNKLCRIENIEERYLPHHGSISKEIREDAEKKMREESHPYSVVCTNTLELGIDIGQLELVVQIDSTHSVMSFSQRLGRTGRKYGSPRIIQIYSSELESSPNDPIYDRIPFSLLKAIAVTELFISGWIEPPRIDQLPYHILYHQILSTLIEKDGVLPTDLVSTFNKQGTFVNISLDDFEVLLKHLSSIDHIEQLSTGEIILGIQGEKVARSYEFYAVFQTPPEWNVFFQGKNIGSITPTPDLISGTCIMLSGQLWEVSEIYQDQKNIAVKRAKYAHNALFAGSGIPDMHPKIAREVFQLLSNTTTPGYLSDLGVSRLKDCRRLFLSLGLEKCNYIEDEKCWALFPWTGSGIYRTLNLLIRYSGFDTKTPGSWVLIIEKKEECDNWSSFIKKIYSAALEIKNKQEIIANLPIQLLLTHKYDEYLPENLVRKRAAVDWLDWEGTIDWLHNEIE